jgi:NAD(P)-dependent dehydrogenase (short-subunit alcohol dehydrogenase family)
MRQGSVALVTGAGSGIGEAIARQLGAAGAAVIVSDVHEDAGRRVARAITDAGGKASFYRADVSKPPDGEALVREAVTRFGALHVAVNNAGISGPIGLTGEYPLDGWEKVLAVNLSGVFYGMRYQVAAIKAAGGGSIVNIASILGQVGFRGSCAYVAAKHGLVGLTRTTALEYAPDKVRVNAVGPAFIKTPMLDVLPPDDMKGIEKLHPMGRLGTADEVAELVLWLASDKSSFVTGSYYAIDGGYLAQ